MALPTQRAIFPYPRQPQPKPPRTGQFGQTWVNNPQMNQFSGMNYWEDLLKKQFGQQGQGQGQVTAPTIGGGWQGFLNQGASPITAQNINAPQMDLGQFNQYLQGGTAAINAAGLQDTSALLKSYDPLLQRQQEQGFASAAQRAGKTGMWGSPYASALGREAGAASAQRANIANQYLYQASEAAANRQLQAETQNRANQLQAAGLSAQQAQAQAQMEMQASQSNQGANLQAQIQSRQNQLQAAGLSADQAYRQAQLEMQGQMANQQAGQGNLDQLIRAYGTIGGQQLGQQQLGQQTLENAMNRFTQQYGDIQSPDQLWQYLSQLYGMGGTNLPTYQ